jgi:hypothetical protein
VVLLIHGTGAAAKEDEGPQWWQRTSPFWRGLDEALRPAAACGPDVFHWSGENSERARRRAARDLLDRYLLPLEAWAQARGGVYHLVAHSHGGNVVWGAVTEAARRRKNLAHLKSVITVGTPFFHFRPTPSLIGMGLPLLASIAGLVWMAPWAWRSFMYSGDALVDGPGPFSLTLLVPLITLALLFGTLATAYLFGAGAVKGAAAMGEGLARHLAWHRLLARGRAVEIWARSDEAINGLRATLGAEGRLAPRVFLGRPGLPGSPIVALGVIGLGATFLPILMAYAVLGLAYNCVVAPLLDQFFLALAARRAQGNDVLGLRVVDVSEGPVPGGPTAPPLPRDIERALVLKANERAAKTLPRLRKGVGLAAVQGVRPDLVVAWTGRKLSWGELVHTSYFETPAVQDFIGRMIRGEGPQSPIVRWRRRPARLIAHRALATAVLTGTLALIGLAVWVGVAISRSVVRTYTDPYQIEAILSEPVDWRAAEGEGLGKELNAPTKWAIMLALAGEPSSALTVAENVEDIGYSAIVETYEEKRREPTPEDLSARIRALALVAEALSVRGRPADSSRASSSALRMARTYLQSNPFPSAIEMFIRAADSLRSAGDRETSMSVLKETERAARSLAVRFQLTALARVSEAYLRAADPVNAERIATEVLAEANRRRDYADVYRSVRVLSSLGRTDAVRAAAEKAYSWAKAASNTNPNGSYSADRYWALGKVAVFFSHAGEADRAFAAAVEGRNPYGYMEAARQLLRAGRVEDARRGVLAAVGIGNSQNACAEAAELLVDVGDTETALNVVSDKGLDSDLAATPRNRVAAALAARGDVVRARALVFQNGYQYHRVKGLCSIADALVRQGRGADAREMVREAHALALTVPNDRQQSVALRAVAGSYARAGRFRDARLAAARCSSTRDKIEGYYAVFYNYLSAQKGGEAELLRRVEERQRQDSGTWMD